MIVKRLLGAAVFAALVAGGASSAQATIIDVTYSGTVSSGYDETGVFGPVSPDLSNSNYSYTATYRFDLSKGTFTDWSPLYLTTIEGGTEFGLGPMSLGATVTVNGKTVSLTGAYDALAYGGNDPSSGSLQGHFVEDQVSGPVTSVFSTSQAEIDSAFGVLPNTPINYNFVYAVQPGDTGTATADINVFNSTDYSFIQRAVVNADITLVTITASPSPTPGSGPAALALLVVAGVLARARLVLAR